MNTDQTEENSSQITEEDGENEVHLEETTVDSELDNGSDSTAEGEEKEVDCVQVELEKWRDIAARSQADLENYRKRMAREKSEALQYANRGLLESLLPIIDNFEMGLQAAKNTEEGENSVIYQGMVMVFKQIEDFLSNEGVETVTAEGQDFDPNIHEAIKQEPSDTVPEGGILYTMRRGYRLKDRLLRAANVVVSSGPEEAPE